MSAAGTAQLILSAVIFLIFLGFLVWGIRTRQFRDVESAKYGIFEDGDGDDAEDRHE